MSGVLVDANDYIGFGALRVDKNDNVWIGSIYKGVLGYNPATHQVISNNKGIEPPYYTYILGMAIDKDNVMWVGNHQGLRTMSQPQDMFTQADKEFKPIKIVYEDAVQLLMDGQKITDIEVDGANNKWLATQGSGVYYFSEDGQQTIYHFTKENSPLPSDDIYDIAIDGSNGTVYFASLNGVVAFKGIATESGENMDDVYAFPNPVNQKHHNFVTIRGLIEGVNVKIVDVEGNLVYETVSRGGSVNWDLTAFGKYKVASGVYIALITNEDGSQTQTTKILVIK
jgi:ligand-binding sensor domain-containing protein